MERKVTVGIFAGAIVAVGVWIAKVAGGVEVPGEVAVSLATIIVGFIQYYVPNAA